MPIVAIIPARYAATRLPGKPLSLIHGRTMIEHVFRRVARAARVDRVIVATDDERIAAAVRAFGGDAVLTAATHRSGTERVAEAAQPIDAQIIVNVQGDEPLLDPGSIDAAIEPLLSDPGLDMATISAPLDSLEEMLSPHVVKVVTDVSGLALYFSRSPIPFVRQQPDSDLRDAAAQAVARGLARRHVGLYVYRRAALMRLVGLPPHPLEQAESLEQLRALAHGLRLRVVAWSGPCGISVDTPADLERARALIPSEPGLAPSKGQWCPPSTSS